MSFASCLEDCQVGISWTEVGKHPKLQVCECMTYQKSYLSQKLLGQAEEIYGEI